MAQRDEAALRGLVGAGPSRVGVTGAMRARDVSRPTEEDLEAAVESLVIRRAWRNRDVTPEPKARTEAPSPSTVQPVPGPPLSAIEPLPDSDLADATASTPIQDGVAEEAAAPKLHHGRKPRHRNRKRR